MLEENPKTVKIAVKHNPGRGNEISKKAAMASMVAHKMGKFWEFHNRLFEQFNSLNQAKIMNIARYLGFDEKAFSKKLGHPSVAARVDQDIRDALAAGVDGTPTVFINGRQLRKHSLEEFRVMIKRELAKIAPPKKTDS